MTSCRPARRRSARVLVARPQRGRDEGRARLHGRREGSSLRRDLGPDKRDEPVDARLPSVASLHPSGAAKPRVARRLRLGLGTRHSLLGEGRDALASGGRGVAESLYRWKRIPDRRDERDRCARRFAQCGGFGRAERIERVAGARGGAARSSRSTRPWRRGLARNDRRSGF